MAYLPRSLDELSTTARAAIRQYLPGTDASLKQNVLYVIAKVMALMSREYELRLEYLARQLFISSAEDKNLEALCADYRIYRKNAAASTGEVEFTALANTTYPSGLRFIAGDMIFAATSPATTDAQGRASMVVAAEFSGTDGNLATGTALGLVDPFTAPTIENDIVVKTPGFGGGADREDDASLRTRGLFRKSNPPQGGSLTDYEQFFLDVPGVSKAWAHRFLNGAGTIGVYFLFDGRPNGIPTPADVAAVELSIAKLRMIRVEPVAIAAALTNVLALRGAPGTTATPFTVSRSWLGEAISQVTGEDSHVLVAPAADVVLTGGEYPVLGVLTFG